MTAAADIESVKIGLTVIGGLIMLLIGAGGLILRNYDKQLSHLEAEVLYLRKRIHRLSNAIAKLDDGHEKDDDNGD